VRVIDAAGQVEKKPAELAASAMSRRSAPIGLVRRGHAVLVDADDGRDCRGGRGTCALNCRCPARQLMLVWLAPVPA